MVEAEDGCYADGLSSELSPRKCPAVRYITVLVLYLHACRLKLEGSAGCS